MFIRADDSWPKSLNGFWGNVLCRYYLGVNQDCSKILIWMNAKMIVFLENERHFKLRPKWSFLSKWPLFEIKAKMIVIHRIDKYRFSTIIGHFGKPKRSFRPMILDTNNGQFEHEFSEFTGLTKMAVPEKMWNSGLFGTKRSFSCSNSGKFE